MKKRKKDNIDIQIKSKNSELLFNGDCEEIALFIMKELGNYKELSYIITSAFVAYLMNCDNNERSKYVMLINSINESLNNTSQCN